MQDTPRKGWKPYHQQVERPKHPALLPVSKLMAKRSRRGNDDILAKADRTGTMPQIEGGTIAKDDPPRAPRQRVSYDILRQLPDVKQETHSVIIA